MAHGLAAELKRRVGQAHLEATSADGGPRRLPTTATVRDLRRLLADPDLAADSPVVLREPTLDDVFLNLTGRSPVDDHEEVPA